MIYANDLCYFAAPGKGLLRMQMGPQQTTNNNQQTNNKQQTWLQPIDFGLIFNKTSFSALIQIVFPVQIGMQNKRVSLFAYAFAFACLSMESPLRKICLCLDLAELINLNSE